MATHSLRRNSADREDNAIAPRKIAQTVDPPSLISFDQSKSKPKDDCSQHSALKLLS